MIIPYCLFPKIFPKDVNKPYDKIRVFDFGCCPYMEFWGYCMMGMCDVRDVGCSGSGMLEMWGVGDVGCWDFENYILLPFIQSVRFFR